MARIKDSDLTTADVYNLVDRLRSEVSVNIGSLNSRIDKVNDKVDGVSLQVSNINGRLMMVPFLISGAINVFFFIINYFITRK